MLAPQPAPSNEVTVSVQPVQPAGPPGSLAVTQIGNHVTLTWASPTTGGPVTRYRLEAGSAPTRADIASVDVGATSYTTLAARGTYYVRVRGMNAAGAGAPSNEVVIAIL